MSYTAARVTLYVILIAVEEDLRQFITLNIIPQRNLSEILNTEDYQKLVFRFKEDLGIDLEDGHDLTRYLDIGQLDQIINSNSDLISKNLGLYFKKITQYMQPLYKIRNRVMHGRPLEIEDLPIVTEFARHRLRDKEYTWNHLEEVIRKIKDDPSFLYNISIPDALDPDRITNNLPIPDYDETGFIGRNDVFDSVKNALKADWPVVTLIGDGGQGKTALALKIAYELLDDESTNFDAIIWTTAKTNRMGVKEIMAIEGAISDSLGIFRDISDNLIGPSAQEYIDEILDYLSQFRILLVIDNLETVLDDRIKDFLRRLPKGSKVLLTSRISLGAYDYPIRIGPMQDLEAIQLIRSLVKVRGVGHLFRVSNTDIMPFIAKMHNNPGYIKWFITALQAGMRAEDALKSGDFLEFCMSNVYQYLDDDSRYALSAFQSLSGGMSYAELSYVTEFEPTRLQKSVSFLQTTNMITTVGDAKITDSETQYTISEFARSYLRAHHPVKEALYKIYISRKRKLTAQLEEVKYHKVNPYSPRTIRATTRSELVAGALLKKSLEADHIDDLDLAFALLEQSKNLSPNFFENYRIEAWLKIRQGDTIAAHEAYERALDLQPQYAPLRNFYGRFQMHTLEDFEGAVETFRFAESLSPSDAEIKIQICRCYLYLKNYSDAKRYLDAAEALNSRNPSLVVKIYDLKMQYFVRKADYEGRDYLYSDALSTIEELKEAYLNIPRNVIDNKMKDSVRKVSRNLEFFIRKDDKKITEWSSELLKWVNSI